MATRLGHMGLGKSVMKTNNFLDVTLNSLFEGLKQAKPGNVSDISPMRLNPSKPYGFGIVEEFTGHGNWIKFTRRSRTSQTLENQAYGPVLKKG